MTPITNEEIKVLEYVIEFKKTNGYSPSVREIGKALGYCGKTAHLKLDALQDKGYITRQPKQPRTITVTRFI